MSVHGVAIRISCRNGRINNPSYKDISATLGWVDDGSELHDPPAGGVGKGIWGKGMATGERKKHSCRIAVRDPLDQPVLEVASLGIERRAHQE